MNNHTPKDMTAIPCVLIDKFMCHLNASEFKLLMFTHRHLQRDTSNNCISIRNYEHGYVGIDGYRFKGVGLSKPTIINNLKSLVNKGILIVDDSANSDGRLWGINWNFKYPDLEISEPYKPIPNIIRQRILERDRWTCQNPYCLNTDSPLTIDHIFPRSMGGSDVLDNLQVLCKSCNSSKGTKTMDEWLGTLEEGGK